MSKIPRTVAIAIAVALAAGCATRPKPAEIHPPHGEESKGGEAAAAVAKGIGRGALMGGGACLMPAAGGARVGGPIGLVVGGAVSILCLPYGLVGGAVIGGVGGAAKHHASRYPSTAPSPEAQALPHTQTGSQCASVVQRDGQQLHGRFGQPISGRFESACANPI